MICVAIGRKNAADVLRALKRVNFAEIRLDAGKFSKRDIRKIFSTPNAALIATYRAGGGVTTRARTDALCAAVAAGAAMVDVEIEAPAFHRKAVVRAAKAAGCQLIISYHNFEETPARSQLERIIAQARMQGADIIKIACQVRSEKDNRLLLSLLRRRERLVVLGMGETGQSVRILSLLRGAEFTFACLNHREKTAPGQLTMREMLRAYREFGVELS